ncbi:C2H2-type zinc finger transcription factor [Mucor lusitanicus]|uniref:C2H2-type zinc finger transcription factor n=2 Tax=Mucor circinelloides f. lusitanicus TaxID=29924 RepID=A0A168IL13_MUCCL|nr:C2H2-type zinc finger transcription factor [Mucor lusitanicus]OAD00068.1 C2H2-type zinc finger transcription factor [Mucor lusitanicus CBS 277.49]
MPIPIEYSSIRRMSTITVPKQDINFDAYDFQLCQPQNDIKGAFESRELEATFCRDFACCGLILDDLHDLLQHYEECHVRLEEDEESSFYDETEASCSGSWSAMSSPTMEQQQQEEVDSDQMVTLKKRAAAYLSDLYNSTSSASSSMLTPPISPCISSAVEEEMEEPTAAPPAAAAATKKSSGKKRTFGQINTPNAFDLLTQSAAKKIALASGNGDLPTPLLTDEDFLAQAGALLASANSNANADKPYKCPVGGCDKAYKNPNGLKYHNQHGHCNMTADDSDNMAKPYQCTIGDCGKRYKNLNGLKYHIEHSHMAALNHTLATFGSTLFSNAFSNDESSQSSSSSY